MIPPSRNPASLLVLGSARAFALPGADLPYYQARSVNDSSVDTATEIEVILSFPATLDQLAQNLQVNSTCLATANPSLSSSLDAGAHCIIPYACCGTSCLGDFCSKRLGCSQGQSTAPIQTGTSTIISTTITTSVAPGSSSSTTSLGEAIPYVNSTGGFVYESTLQPTSPTTASNTGSLHTSSQSSAGPRDTNSQSISSPSPSLSKSISSASESVTTSASYSSTSIAGSVSGSTSKTGSSLLSVSSAYTSVNSEGQTIISASGVEITLPTGISAGTTITTDGTEFTFTPSVNTASGSNTIRTSLTSSSGKNSVTTSSESQLTSSTTQSSAASNSGISASDSTSSSGSQSLSPTASTSYSTTVAGIAVTTNSLGQTVISDSSETTTLPTGISTSSVVTLSDGSVFTIRPSNVSISVSATTASSSSLPIGLPPLSSSSTTPVVIFTTANSAGQTIVTSSSESDTTASPKTTVTEPNGSISVGPITPAASVTSSSSSATSSTDGGLIIFPITTPVAKPTSSGDDSVVPCKAWFFFFCINWGGINVDGWSWDPPIGIRPPGPPPGITFPPGLHISVNIEGTLPNWPEITIGPDHIPTYSAEPSNCETESAEVCMTSTSYGVSSTVTTASHTLSTCATVYGCNVQASASSTTATSACTSCTSCFTFDYGAGYPWNDDSDGDEDAAARKVRRTAAPTLSTLVRTVVVAGSPTETTPAPTAPPEFLAKRVVNEQRSSTKFGNCELVSSVTMKDYPDVSDYANYPAASTYFPISKKSTKDGTCYAGYIFSTADLAGVSAQDPGPTYVTVSAPAPTPRVNSDHVYELALLGNFFAYALSLPGAPTCDEFNQVYVEQGLVQQLFDKLPNIDYPDFAAMDWFVNRAKAGYVVTASPNNVPNNGYQKAADSLQLVGLVAQFMNLEPIIQLFRTTHQRLYDVFGAWDEGFQGCKESGVSATWAATYSAWMTSHLSSRGDLYTSAASSWYSILDAGSAAGAKKVPVYTQLKNSFPTASFDMPVAAMAQGLTVAAPGAGAIKRQAACSFSATISGSASPSGSLSGSVQATQTKSSSKTGTSLSLTSNSTTLATSTSSSEFSSASGTASWPWSGTCVNGEGDLSENTWGACQFSAPVTYGSTVSTILQVGQCPSTAACPSAGGSCIATSGAVKCGVGSSVPTSAPPSTTSVVPTTTSVVPITTSSSIDTPTVTPVDLPSITVSLYQDAACQTPVVGWGYTVVDLDTCDTGPFKTGWSSARNINASEVEPGNTLTFYTKNNCGCPTCGSHGYNADDTGCLTDFGFTANALGYGDVDVVLL